MADKPLVFILDIDGTLIGDIRPQIMLYEMNCMMKTSKKSLMNTKEFQERLRNSGIVRPFAVKFIKTIQGHLPNSEIFIYTASEKKWASFLIANFEKAFGIRFNKPIFTRDNCSLFENEHRKHVNLIHPMLLKSLKKRYPLLRKGDLENRIMIVDNTLGVFEEIDRKHLVTCPTYDYKYPENIPAYIDEHLFSKYHNEVLTILNRYIRMSSISTYLDFQREYYIYYVKYLENLAKYNIEQSKDQFFMKLLNIIVKKDINIFTPKVIQYISRKMLQTRH